MRIVAGQLVYSEFRNGWRYSRHPIALPPGTIADGANVLVMNDEIMQRPFYERAYNNHLTTRTANLKVFYLPTGQYIVLSINTDGSYQYVEGMSESATWSVVSGVSGYSTHGDARAFREAIWITTGCSRPYRLVPSWSAGGATRYQYAGCYAPGFSPSDTAIETLVERGGFMGAGHYYYAMTLLYGTDGKWGESRPGAVGQATVTTDDDGVGRVVDTGTGLPAASTTYVPGSDPRYYGCCARRLYRTVAGGDRNGPYYFVQQVNDMSTTAFEDNLNDTSLSDTIIGAKYLNDDEQIPPVCEFCEIHDGRMIYADDSHIWWSEVGLSAEPLPDLVHSVRNMMNLPLLANEWIMGLASVQGTLIVATNQRIFYPQVGLGASIRTLDTSRGCVAKKTWAPGRNGIFYLSREGPSFLGAGQSGPLGNPDAALRIKHYLEDFCNNWELCSGVYHDGRYYLAYPDRRDSPPPENACTRTLVWDDDLGCWMPPWNVPMNCGVSEAERLIWLDGTHASRGYIMQFNPSRRTDWIAAGAVGDTAMTARARFGNYAGHEMGALMVLARAYLRAKVPTGTGLTVTGFYDGTAGTSKTLAVSPESRPLVQLYPFERKMANAVELELKSTTAAPRWALVSMAVEMGDSA